MVPCTWWYTAIIGSTVLTSQSQQKNTIANPARLTLDNVLNACRHMPTALRLGFRVELLNLAAEILDALAHPQGLIAAAVISPNVEDANAEVKVDAGFKSEIFIWLSFGTRLETRG